MLPKFSFILSCDNLKLPCHLVYFLQKNHFSILKRQWDSSMIDEELWVLISFVTKYNKLFRLLRCREPVWCLMKRTERRWICILLRRQLFTKAGVEAMPTYQMRYSKDNTVHWLDLVTPAVSFACCWHYFQYLQEVGN